MRVQKILQKGFSLIELSIVVVIVGIIIAGVYTAGDVSNNAKKQTTISSLEKFQSAYDQFKLKYSGLPGDLADATNYFAGTVNGNGDGIIQGPTQNEGEDYRAWQHLALAGGINGDFSGKKTTTGTSPLIIGKDVPASPYRKAPFTIYTEKLYDTPAVTAIHMGRLGDRGSKLDGGAVTPQASYDIDRKMDDGAANAGKVMAMNINYSTDNNHPTKCVTSDFAYNSANKLKDCVLAYRLENPETNVIRSDAVCPVGYVLQPNGVCKKSASSAVCPVNQIMVDGLCTTTAAACQAGFSWNPAKLKCEKQGASLIKCISGRGELDGVCVLCPSNTYLSGGKCLPKAVCAYPLITDNGSCVCRSPGAGRLDGVCVICPTGYFLKIGTDSSRTCMLIPTSCPEGQEIHDYFCIPICAPDQEIFQGTWQCVTRTTCPEGYEFHGECLLVSCPAGSWLDISVNPRVCRTNPICDGPYESPYNGTCKVTCPSNMVKQGNTCVPKITCTAPYVANYTTGQCDSPCPSGYELVGYTCEKKTFEYSCPSGYELNINDQCVVGNDVLECPSGSTYNSDPESSDFGKCLTANNDYTCPTGYELSEDQQSCNCPEGYTKNADSECVP